jgi:cytochrome P450
MEMPGLIITADPPGHTRLRRLVAKTFTVRRVDLLRPRVAGLVNSLIDGLCPPADLVAGLAWPVPITVISELLGVPEADRATVRSCVEMTMALGIGIEPDEIAAARTRLVECLTNVVAERRSHPADDLISALVSARDDDGALSEDELVRLCWAMLIAGYESTARQIGNFLYLLLEQRSRWEHLVADPSAIPAAIEELLRYTPLPVSVEFPRIATEDVEVAGQVVRAGDAVFVQMHSANRDDQVFQDPDVLDLARAPGSHLAFGHGIHHCLGAQLARMELQVVLDVLVRRLPGLRLAGDVDWVADRLVRGPRTLPVTW